MSIKKTKKQARDTIGVLSRFARDIARIVEGGAVMVTALFTAYSGYTQSFALEYADEALMFCGALVSLIAFVRFMDHYKEPGRR